MLSAPATFGVTALHSINLHAFLCTAFAPEKSPRVIGLPNLSNNGNEGEGVVRIAYKSFVITGLEHCADFRVSSVCRLFPFVLIV